MGLDRSKWKATGALDIPSLVKIATTLKTTIMLNEFNSLIFNGLRTWKYRLPPVD